MQHVATTATEIELTKYEQIEHIFFLKCLTISSASILVVVLHFKSLENSVI